MLAAALDYARRGWSVFPAPPGEKKSFKSARHSGGRKWGKTRDLDEIKQDWATWSDANVGIPTGAENGFFVVEADTMSSHGVNGIASLSALEQQHGKLPDTLMAISPSGSTHYYWKWMPGIIIKNSASRIAPGVDVRGEGGMVIAPPSSRSDGDYRWLNDLEPAEAPRWLVDAALTAAPASTFDPSGDQELTADEPRIAAALAVIPNSIVDWEFWNKIAMAIWAGTKGSDGGRKIFHDWSKKSDKYNADNTDAKWAKLTSCPPQSIGAGTIFYHADQADPTWESRFVNGESEPVDLWNRLPLPALPTGILPSVIETYARDKAKLMGCDPAGLAMAALTICAAAIPDGVKLKVKRYDTWSECARLWTALVAPPSGKKTPIINEVKRPFALINREMVRANIEAKQQHDALPKEERQQTPPPKQPCILVEDTTIEAMQEVFRDSHDGVLVLRDELSGWFGSMDKYSGNRGAMADRGFWLTAWNGGSSSFHRIGRGSGYMPNVSASVLGGIQPDLMRKLIKDTVDDGLIQRICPIMLTTATAGTDAPTSDSEAKYDDLVVRLRKTTVPLFCQVTLAEGAMKIREELEQKHLDLMACEAINARLAAHIGKYDGIFVRLCLLWHCIESPGPEVGAEVPAATARRVADFLHKFMLPHAMSFYASVVGLTEDDDNVIELANYILAHGLKKVTNREVMRGSRQMRRLDRQEIETVCFQLDALSWLDKIPSRRRDSPEWQVNEKVHSRFADRAKREKERRQRDKEMIKAMCAGGS
jgi:hypothetical protein